ncbi:MAG: hypothetical protein ACREFP_02770 [Acetobacteraceae bacterium]
MLHRYGAVAAAATLLIPAAASAESLAPIESRSITLGPLTGGVYDSVVPNGYRVVVTLQSGTPPSVVRFIATLAPGQSVTLFPPRGVGEPPIAVQIEGRGNQLPVANAGQRSETTARATKEAAAAHVMAEAP